MQTTFEKNLKAFRSGGKGLSENEKRYLDLIERGRKGKFKNKNEEKYFSAQQDNNIRKRAASGPKEGPMIGNIGPTKKKTFADSVKSKFEGGKTLARAINDADFSGSYHRRNDWQGPKGSSNKPQGPMIENIGPTKNRTLADSVRGMKPGKGRAKNDDIAQSFSELGQLREIRNASKINWADWYNKKVKGKK